MLASISCFPSSCLTETVLQGQNKNPHERVGLGDLLAPTLGFSNKRHLVPSPAKEAPSVGQVWQGHAEVRPAEGRFPGHRQAADDRGPQLRRRLCELPLESSPEVFHLRH